MKILWLQNTGGFYGCTVVVLTPDQAEVVEKKLMALGQPMSEPHTGHINLGSGHGITWMIKDAKDGVAVFPTGGEDDERLLLQGLGLV